MGYSGPRRWFWVLVLVFAATVVTAAARARAAPTPREVFNNNKGLCSIFVQPAGYPCREYSVPTDDGYLLGVQRMRSKNRAPTRGPAFLYHGIMQGGDIWVINPPQNSLAFALADAGYDVFIGNTRSSSFSYGHVSLTENADDFWDWNWDDLVDHDLPSMLRFVYDQSNRQSINYVGFSQGTMTAFAAFGNRNIAMLVKKAAMLSPVAYLENVQAPMLSVASWMFMDKVLLLAGVAEFRVENSGGRRLITSVCDRMHRTDCYDNLLDLVTGPNCCIDKSRRPIYNRYEMQGTSMKNLAQMAQMVRSGDFAKYDYGVLGNLRHYRSLSPPSYDLSAVPKNLPLLLIRGEKDELSGKKDADRLVQELPGNPTMIQLPRYAHGDVILASDASAQTFKRVLDFFGH